MRKRITLLIFIALLIVGAVAVLWALLFYHRTPGQWKQVTIATATEGGKYYPLGKQLALILEQLPGKFIESAKAERTEGSKDNVKRLVNGEADVAFVMGPALVEAEQAEREELRILARLYKDVVQVVIRKDSEIGSLKDLKDKRVFIGADDSGTRIVAKKILEDVKLLEEEKEYFTPVNADSYDNAVEMLQEKKLHAAFFVAGTPTVAVEKALQSGKCRLLSLEDELRKRLGSWDFRLENANIPANFYPNQPDAVETVGADVFLVCRKDLPKDLAFVILEALFDNIERLLFAHAKAQEIKLMEAFDVPEGFELHPGAEEFQEDEKKKLLIATGALDGKYYHVGKAIQDILEPLGIHCRVTHTDGSLENAELLSMVDLEVIAIMQYDAALASYFGDPSLVYNCKDLPDINQVSKIRRIAALHEEKLHVVVRRKKLEQIEMRELGKKITTLGDLKEEITNLRPAEIKVCLGPKRSATRLVARAIFEHHGIESNSIEESPLSVSEMVYRLQNEELDMGFFVSYVPSEAMKAILHDPDFKLLSLGKEQVKMAGRVFTTVTIDPNTYGCQKEKEGEVVRTLATQAVLVTTEDLEFDVGAITEAIHKWGDLLGVAGSTMAKELPSVPLHPDAERYYKKAGLLPSEPPLLHRLQWMWYILGCLTMLITVMFIPAYTGLIILRRSRTGNEIGRRILAIPIEANARDSVQRLLKIRDEIQQRVRRRWWKWGELDKHRWRYLRDLIHDRIGEAKENLTRTFVAEIHAVTTDPKLDKTTRKQRYRSIEGRILEYFEKAELDPSQQKMLRELLRETSQQDTKTTESKGIKK